MEVTRSMTTTSPQTERFKYWTSGSPSISGSRACSRSPDEHSHMIYVSLWKLTAGSFRRSTSLGETAPRLKPPSFKHPCRIGKFDLQVEAPREQVERRIMRFVGGAAQPVLYDHNGVTEIDGGKDGGEHANIGFRAAYDQGVNVHFPEPGVELPGRECRIDRLVD